MLERYHETVRTQITAVLRIYGYDMPQVLNTGDRSGHLNSCRRALAATLQGASGWDVSKIAELMNYSEDAITYMLGWRDEIGLPNGVMMSFEQFLAFLSQRIADDIIKPVPSAVLMISGDHSFESNPNRYRALKDLHEGVISQ